LVKDPDSGVVLHDLSAQSEPWLFLRGGRGGRGNWHFKSSTLGQKGMVRRVLVELALIADIGLVGKPNAGKSTLLSVLTNSHPKIGAYPFTTKIPNIGVCSLYDNDIVLADIPGIIQGAAQGAGLGLQFLKHISRTNLILFLIDLHDSDPGLSYHMLGKELGTFSAELTRKPRLVVGTKMDLDGAGDRLLELRAAVEDQDCLGISAVTGFGIGELKRTLFHSVGRHR
jgi:GTP-binding protein